MQAEYIVGTHSGPADALYDMVSRANLHPSHRATDPFGGIDHLHKRTGPTFDKVSSLRRAANSYSRPILSPKYRSRFEQNLIAMLNKIEGLREVVWVFLATSERWKHACEHLEPQIFLVA
jgi:hypothetical protein